MFKKIVFVFCLFSAFEVKADGFEDSEKWLKLLHYQKNMFGSYVGTVKNDAFYVSQNGRKNPKDELLADIELFEGDDEKRKCFFPARYLVLKKEGLVQKDFPKCEDFEQFKKDLKPNGVTMLFTDAYMNNSSSLFGHTLFRIDTARSGTQLLAHGVNYGAYTNGYETSPFYAIYGLLGFFQGGLTIKPYYNTINTYNNIENRDIWEYELDLSSKDLELFVAHIWEIGNVTTPYYFFSQNCSYMLVEILDAIKPDLQLADEFRKWVIPLDTIRVVNNRGIIKKINYRPSRERKIKYRLKQMDQNQKKAYYALTDDENADISFLREEQKADVLETAYQYVQYQYVAKDLDLKEYRKKSFRFLKERSKVAVGQKFDNIKEGNDPKDGHLSAMFGASVGARNGRVFEQIFFRPAYHAVTDNPFGYLKGSAINFLETYFAHIDHHDKYVFEKLHVLELDSFAPFQRGFWAPSYRIKFDVLRTVKIKSKKEGYVSKGEVAGGTTVALSDDFWGYVLSSLDGAYGGFLSHNGWVGASGAVGVLYSGDVFGFQAELKKTFATQKQGSIFEQSLVLNLHVLKNTDFEAKINRKSLSSNAVTEISFAVKRFF
ncbi:MAG: DUF4105 domain-containing protein [Alphaproteobacteria bacterium]|nr:DUF4105 domain-containing protein [Alphaproteobacteria bacterium]